jgi:organic hydroperoxide reductase OsmC/OhrA
MTTTTKVTPSVMPDESTFTLELEHLQGYEFRLKFDWPDLPAITLDEPAPLGTGHGPNASRLLAAAIANCLTASLLFCLNKSHAAPRAIATKVSGTMARNDKGKMRVGEVRVSITLDLDAENQSRLARCTELFEDYCVVTQSVRQGLPVHVQVTDTAGRLIYRD